MFTCWRSVGSVLNSNTDQWKLTSEALPNESGAGWLFKRAKAKNTWNRRYFTITETKLEYYSDSDRTLKKGLIVIAGSTAQINVNRQSTPEKKYFVIVHPQCGTRDFYARTNNERTQWIEALNAVSKSLKNESIFGNLRKLSGMMKRSWQVRWCICAGDTLDYFNLPSDNIAKGSIDLLRCNVRECTQGSELNCFEIAVTVGDGVGAKKYVFATDNETERQRWVNMITKIKARLVDSVRSPTGSGAENSATVNPLMLSPSLSSTGATASESLQNARSSFSEEGDDDIKSQNDANSAFNSQSPYPATAISATELVQSGPAPESMSGYLLKKSPKILRGYQRRYFELRAPGELAYYIKEEDALGGKDPKGIIPLIPNASTDLSDTDSDLAVTQLGVAAAFPEEFLVHLQKRSYAFRAEGEGAAAVWARAIDSWTRHRAANGLGELGSAGNSVGAAFSEDD